MPTPWEKLDEAKRLLREFLPATMPPASRFGGVATALRLVEEATTPIDPTRRHQDGPYGAELAEAFRSAARDFSDSQLADRIHIDADALVEEGEGGAIVWAAVFVSDAERAPLAEEHPLSVTVRRLRASGQPPRAVAA